MLSEQVLQAITRLNPGFVCALTGIPVNAEIYVQGQRVYCLDATAKILVLTTQVLHASVLSGNFNSAVLVDETGVWELKCQKSIGGLSQPRWYFERTGKMNPCKASLQQ